MPAPGYVGMSVSPEARAALRRVIYAVTGRTQRQVGVSEAMIAVSILAERHMDELTQIMEQPEQ